MNINLQKAKELAVRNQAVKGEDLVRIIEDIEREITQKLEEFKKELLK